MNRQESNLLRGGPVLKIQPSKLFGVGCLTTYLLFAGIAWGDDSGQATPRSAPLVPSDAAATQPKAGSENYYKDENFLPGEGVVTPTGQKMKVWSTAGPVKVSPAPQPFDDPQATKLDDVDVLIDGAKLLQQNQVGERVVPGPGRGSELPRDSFELGR